MNSLHLLLSTVDKALSINNNNKDSSQLLDDTIELIDDEIVSRVDPQDLSNNNVFNEEDDLFYLEDLELEEQQKFDTHSSNLIWKILYVIFFIPNVLVYKPISYIVLIITYPFKITFTFIFRLDQQVEEEEEEEEEEEIEEEASEGVSSGVDIIDTPRRDSNNLIPTISEEEDDDLEFEIPSESALLAEKLKSPTSQRSTIGTEDDEQQLVQSSQQVTTTQQRKKLKKKKQRFVFPRLLINNSFDLHNPPASIKKKTLILDLDETLIHSLSRHNSSVFSKSKGKMIEIKLSNQLATLYYIYKRPFVDEFLNIVKNWYNLICFTASIKEYADPVINFLEEDFINNKGPKLFSENNGDRLFQKRYYRNDCIWEKGVGYIKDLSIITGESESVVDETPTKNRGRVKDDDSGSESSSSKTSPLKSGFMNKDFVDPSKLIIIDNSPVSYRMNKENGIMIEGWINDPNDLELMNLLPLLNSLRFTSDVRAILSLKDGEFAFNEK